MLKVSKNIQKLQYGILAKHMMGHDAQDKTIHKKPKVVSCFYTLIVKEVPRNLGVGVSWWGDSEHGEQDFWVSHFLKYRKLHHLWLSRQGKGLLQMILLPLDMWCLVVRKVLCCPN